MNLGKNGRKRQNHLKNKCFLQKRNYKVLVEQWI